MDDNNKNKRKSNLIMAAVIFIIILFFVGIVYQFVYIKKLERRLEDLQSQLCQNVTVAPPKNSLPCTLSYPLRQQKSKTIFPL